MDAIWHALDRNAMVLDSTLTIYRKPEWKKARRQWRKQAADTRSAQQKFHRVTLGLK